MNKLFLNIPRFILNKGHCLLKKGRGLVLKKGHPLSKKQIMLLRYFFTKKPGNRACPPGIWLFCSLALFPIASKAALTSSAPLPLTVTSDRLELHDQQGLAIFYGNVCAQKGVENLYAERMDVYYAKQDKAPSALSKTSMKIKKIEAQGHVHYTKAEQSAFGDDAVFFPEQNRILVTGKDVLLTNGESQAHGCKLTLNTLTSEARLESCLSGKNKTRVAVTFKKGAAF